MVDEITGADAALDTPILPDAEAAEPVEAVPEVSVPGETSDLPVAPAGLRFEAPEHTSSISFSTGRGFAVKGGILTLPDDLIDAERASLAAYGFTPLS